MIDKDKILPDPNLTRTTDDEFVEYYNQNIPNAFPRVTALALEKFRASHPDLFKGSKKWTIDKHRKKLMDWLASHKEEV